MKQLIDCDTCGYPLLPEEREGLVEIDGKMCKPRKPLTDAQKLDLVTNWFAEDWAIKKALGLLRDYEIERAHGIGEKNG